MRRLFLVFFITNFFVIAETIGLDSLDAYQIGSFISCKTLADGRFEYAISNKIFKPDKSYRYVFDSVPESGYYFLKRPKNVDEVFFDSTQMDVIIRGKITLEELIAVFDDRAKMGMLPYYWDEFVVRDKKSEKYDPSLYRLFNIEGFDRPGDLVHIQKFKILNDKMILISLTSGLPYDGEKVPGISYGLLYEKEQYKLKILSKGMVGEEEKREDMIFNLKEIPLRFNNEETVSVKFNKHSPFCMVEDRYALRIFNSENEYIWEDTLNVFGAYCPLVFDFNKDGIDEIVMYRQEHGIIALLLLKKTKD